MLGEMGVDATHFVLGQHWKNHFLRKAAETGGAMTVGQLRKWIDDPKAMGLPKEAQNLVILLFAAQTNRTFYLHGSPDEVSLANIADAHELREQRLPTQASWEVAVQRAGAIFGVTVSRLLSAGNVSKLISEVKKKASETWQPCRRYRQRLGERSTKLGVPADSDRLRTATATQALVERLCSADAETIVGLLENAEVATSESAMGECVGKAAELEGNLETAGWEIFEAVERLTDERQGKARQILVEVREALQNDEHALQLAPALKGAQAKAVQLLTKQSEGPHVCHTLKPQVKPGRREVQRDTKEGLTLTEAEACLSRLGRELKPGQTARINMGWVIEEGGEA
jgi:hypothetical protein